ncbi:MAG: 16S rRNA (guanine(966)-N(2))-methyltransferase RsmD [Gammaproteobacteria bacterium]|nr:16S rRNA (guanine(966)-N(2))-methyltransferase RsmD [Gammaproteobacteria bacterium]|tara:strand:+ start:87 stop:668 length:582 start_codon:yes stop_codon:yes gene_type:complete
MVTRRNNSKNRGKVRITSGEWKNRNLEVPDIDGLRPTSERVRETLFNWLMPSIHKSVCLDLFAGSGSLGFEALSRGARHCTFVEKSKLAFRQIKTTRTILNAMNSEAHNCDAIDFLSSVHNHNFNLVFLDPPFSDDYLISSIESIHEYQLVSRGGYIYIEFNKNNDLFDLPDNWSVIRKKIYGNVCFILIEVV